jgi:hypothetical protein
MPVRPLEERPVIRRSNLAPHAARHAKVAGLIRSSFHTCLPV